MASFDFSVQVPLELSSLTSAALGASSSAPFTGKEIGKCVKLATTLVGTYIVCANGDDIEGFVESMEPGTMNDGFGWGTVQTKERRTVYNKGSGAIAVGALVVAAAQPAIGTAITVSSTSASNSTGVYPGHVKEGTPTLFKWRVISLLGGAGAVDSVILIERV